MPQNYTLNNAPNGKLGLYLAKTVKMHSRLNNQMNTLSRNTS